MRLIPLLMIGVVMMATAAGAASAADLPLSHVVLYSSGVGFFQHQGLVHDDETIPLSFRAYQINDILKSMVLQDLSGGTIGPVTYAPRDPLDRTLSSFAVDIADEPALGELLSRLRGAEVAITTTSAGEVRGTILGTEWQSKTVDDNVVEFEVVNVVTAEGMRQVPIWHIQDVRLLDAELSSDLGKALAAIAANRDVSKRGVDLHFTGTGARQVSVGYLLETPVWKTTYRLVADEGESFLQGWAIVENTTDTDWEAVNLSLVSGRPVSFTQDLYQPIYVDRPDVPVQTQVAARPRLYEGDLGAPAEAEAADELALEERTAGRMAMPAPSAPAAEMMMGAPGMAMGGFGGGMMADGLAAGVAAAAAGEEVGEMFHYAINQPITISRQGSAMIPIVNQAVETEKISIYSQSANPKYPMHGLRLTNSTGLSLMGGAITVFDGGAYAGDALVSDLGPGDERLVSYAMDTAVEVSPESKGGDQIRQSVKIVNGVLIAQTTQTMEMEYTIRNNAEVARTVLIEHPRRSDWEIVEPAEPAETTRDLYRIEVEVAPNATEKLTVKMQQPLTERVALTSESIERVGYYMQWRELPADVKAALQRIIEMKQQIAGIDREIEVRQARLTQIGEEQDRIRQNMEQLDHENELYTRYVQKLTEQEDEFDRVRKEIDDLTTRRNGLQTELEAYIANLNVG
jgi:small nuclear ribonucleoprotein (snRNP)-like protein